MARFHFSLSSFVGQHTSAAIVSQRTLRALRIDEAVGEPNEPRQGPGWFASSWDLIHGLDVREGLPFDARLNDWRGTALVDVTQFNDLDLGLLDEPAHADAFSDFGIDGLALV